MATTGVTPVGMWAQSTGKVTTEANGKLGKQEFLAMLIAQMKYQDPLNPLDNSQMIAQMATFSQLEQTLAQSEALTNMEAVSMVGKYVSAMSSDGTVMGGRVAGVSPGDDPILTLEDGSLVALKDVRGVSESTATLDAVAMLGRIVTYPVEEGGTRVGKVASVTTGDDPILTLVDGTKVYMRTVQEVSL